MNSRFLIMLIVALILAGSAAWMANRWVLSQTNRAPALVEQTTTPVYVAAANIPYATRIELAHIKLAPWPKDNVPPDAFTEADTKGDPNAIVGKVAQRDFLPGEALLKPQVKEHIGGSTLSALIQEGMRAISVRVDDVVGVAGFILPGNKADILLTRDGTTSTLLKDIKILAIDQIASKDPEKPAIVVRALTLEVTPKQAEVLVHAMRTGALQFALRNPADTEGKTVPLPIESQPVASLKPITAAKEPVTVKILPWTSQAFQECKDNSC